LRPCTTRSAGFRMVSSMARSNAPPEAKRAADTAAPMCAGSARNAGKRIDVAGRQGRSRRQVLDHARRRCPAVKSPTSMTNANRRRNARSIPYTRFENPDGRHRVGLQQAVEPLLGHHAPVGAFVGVFPKNPANGFSWNRSSSSSNTSRPRLLLSSLFPSSSDVRRSRAVGDSPAESSRPATSGGTPSSRRAGAPAPICQSPLVRAAAG